MEASQYQCQNSWDGGEGRLVLDVEHLSHLGLAQVFAPRGEEGTGFNVCDSPGLHFLVQHVLRISRLDSEYRMGL